GRARITDFGLSHRAGEASRFGGTPAYMAPEQFATRAATRQSDLYALGLLLAEILSEELPVIQRCLRPNPEERPGSAKDVLAAIEAEALDQPSDRALRLTRAQGWMAVALTIAALALLVLLSRLPAARASAPLRPLLGNIYLVLLSAALAGGALMAWRNLRAGGVDRIAATRAALFVFVCRSASGIAAAARPSTVQDTATPLSSILALSLFLAVQVWLAQVAIEPYVRRVWPDALVSWRRLLRGRVRDSLIGRDVLLGILAGAIMRLATPSFVPLTFAGATYALARAVFYALFALVLLVLLRMAVRQPWLAAALWLVATTVTWSWGAPPAMVAAVPLEMLILLLGLQRLGLLAAAVAIFTLLIAAV